MVQAFTWHLWISKAMNRSSNPGFNKANLNSQQRDTNLNTMEDNRSTYNMNLPNKSFSKLEACLPLKNQWDTKKRKKKKG